MYLSKKKVAITEKLSSMSWDVPTKFLMSRKQGLSYSKCHKDMFKQGVLKTALARAVDRRKNWTITVCKWTI
mgnify:CR=1 FL=1